MEILLKCIYNIVSIVVVLLLKIASLFNNKLRQFFHSRSRHRNIPHLSKSIIFHCASLGEYEESLPLIEKINQHYGECSIVISVFSHSAYQYFEDRGIPYEYVYIPLDSFGNYNRYIENLNPRLVFISKYEFWYGFLSACHTRKIKVIHFNTKLEKIPLLWKIKTFGKLIKGIEHYYVADEGTHSLLSKIGISNITLSSDLRIDRAIDIFAENKKYDLLNLNDKANTIIFGSTWLADENLIIPFIQNNPTYNYIIAPHQINERNIQRIETALGIPSQRWSRLRSGKKWNILIIDTIGDLKYLYRYACIGYIGGAQDHKVHNILEAAVYGIPVVYGKNHKNMSFASYWIRQNYAKVVDKDNISDVLLHFRFDTKKSMQAIHKIGELSSKNPILDDNYIMSKRDYWLSDKS